MPRPPGPAPSRLSAHLSAVAAAFVCLALVALAGSPLFTFRRLDALRTEEAATTGAAASDLVELRLLFTEEVLLHQALRANTDPTAGRRYGVVRAREDVLLARLDRLAPRIGPPDGPPVRPRLSALEAAAGRWHVRTDARAAGRTPDTAFVRELPAVRAGREATLAAHAALADAVARVDARARRVGARTVADQRLLSAVLGALALGAAAAVAGFARRDRRLTRALARAVDEEHRLRAEAERQREALLRLGESKARLVRGFTHDVKNPIGAADGYLGLLEEGVPDPVTPAQRRHVERARRSLGAALHLIGDLLDVARAEAGVIEVRRVPTDLAAVASEAAEEYRAAAERKGLRLRVLVGDAPATVASDPVRVRQVLGNLIANAVKYTECGQVVVRLLGTRASRDDGPEEVLEEVLEGAAGAAPGGAPLQRYAVEVSDTGLGIAPEHQARLFEEFVRLAPDAAPGVGVGLAISRRIARALGGDLAVRSAAGRGSTFVLWLPAPPAPPAAPVLARALPAAACG